MTTFRQIHVSEWEARIDGVTYLIRNDDDGFRLFVQDWTRQPCEYRLTNREFRTPEEAESFLLDAIR